MKNRAVGLRVLTLIFCAERCFPPVPQLKERPNKEPFLIPLLILKYLGFPHVWKEGII